MNLLVAAKIVWAAGCIGWYVIRLPFERKVKRERVVDARDRLRELVLLSCSTLGLGIVPLFWATSRVFDAANYPYSPVQFALGTLTFIFALWLFRRTHRDLGKNWSVTLEIKDAHKLITGGVYRHVRHPMYSAFFLWALAQFILIPNWIVGPAGFIGFGILYAFRIGREERMMLDTFGDEYRAYSARTARLIPGVY
ncbi:isoprenylcysteine carboxylmethyltransferase family protein [Ancylobacter dichloromethanicus]|uniref:Farnesyl cysteine carboxyl-methyltransferase n=1 Tax=Ancylobacter dichloromethanicus TaxID=518825 RepID=A0A9W6JDE0_9HYPH|nr:protein-S-isoprenylcysteine O-methyltransferase [Ancylobacter dichloromethanicus]MBS7553440.1 isoprenylcysteine carboxylmethyltransferase family protein [Ancylobacter dichloromethanicus]GLK74361.1 farnesyl cysteine carboxyl-methyltransferase [Ancylobacter dichloromethanicus]